MSARALRNWPSLISTPPIWPARLRKLRAIRTQRTIMVRWVRIARNFRSLAGQMGGVLIKLGQFLSARADILPLQITDALAGLQDEVPPAPLAYILATIVDELGASPDQLFAAFDPVPVAAASF